MKQEEQKLPLSFKQPAKKITLAILVIVFLMGLVITFFPKEIMENFKTFLYAYLPFFLGMVGSIGVNSALEKRKGL